MKIRIAALVSLCAVLIFTASQALALSPEDIIRRSNTADRSISFRGVKTINIYAGKRVQAAKVKVVHLKPEKTRVEYLSPKEIAGIVTIEKGDESWRYLPGKGKWEHQQWDLGEENLTLALKNYKVVSAGSGSIAGRSTYVVKIVPKQSGIPGQTIWIDKHTYLVLKSEVRGPSGSLRSSSAFTSIEFNPKGVSSSLFEPKGSITDEPETGALKFDPIRPGYLPKGYVLVGISPVKVNGGVSAHLQYTNGINTISIFQKMLPRPASSKEHVEKKPNGVTIITTGKGKLGITVIGDIDSKELMKIAKSLR